ncbi:hypothetical protein QTP88_021105 [Uroleucon formosanum]
MENFTDEELCIIAIILDEETEEKKKTPKRRKMSEYCFNTLLEKLYVYLKKKDTHWKKAVTPKEVAVCLRSRRQNFESPRPTTLLLRKQYRDMSYDSMASKLVFSPSEDEILLQEIQANPILFDLSDANYKNIVMKDSIWKEISLKIGKTVDDTKKRWKNIRDSYSRNKRKPGTGLAPHLSFLDRVEYERVSTSNVSEVHEIDTTHGGDEYDEVSSEIEDILLAETPPVTTQQPLIHIPSENTYNIQPLSSFEATPSTNKVKSLPPGTSQRKIAEKLCVPKSTVAKLLKEEVILRENFNSTQTGNQKRKREGKDPEVDEALSEWFSLITSRDVRVSGPMLKCKAEELSRKIGNNQFIATDGWLSRWKNRHEIKFKRVHGEKASADESASNDWKVDRLKIILNDFSPDNIFNADETGLYYRATPDGSLCFKKNVLSGSKKAMDRITVLLLGKSLKPRCFKNMSINKMPVHYHANKNAWMTSTIFSNWLYECDKELQAKSRSILLLIDNCAAHPKNVQLKNITLEFLPPNTTSLIQPLDMGIIKNLKVKYRMKLVHFILEKIEESLFDQSATADKISGKINILQAIQFVSESWREVSCSTIMNCFAHCGFSNFIGPQPELTELDEQYFFVQNHKEFENIDENAPCFDDNEEICDVVVQNVLKKRKLEDYDEEEEEDTEPPVTAREARKCIDLLQKRCPYILDSKEHTKLHIVEHMFVIHFTNNCRPSKQKISLAKIHKFSDLRLNGSDLDRKLMSVDNAI